MTATNDPDIKREPVRPQRALVALCITALTGWYGPDRVRALTTLTLATGFASTIFAPLTAALLDHLTWRETYLALAAILAVVTVPLHALCLTPPWAQSRHQAESSAGLSLHAAHVSTVVRSRGFLTLTAAMAVAGFGMFAATVNLVPLLTDRGMGTHLAALTLGLRGAGQVLGRVGYPQLSRRSSLRTRTLAVLAAGAAAILILGLLPGPHTALITVAIVAGAIRGLFTLLQAMTTSDLELPDRHRGPHAAQRPISFTWTRSRSVRPRGPRCACGSRRGWGVRPRRPVRRGRRAASPGSACRGRSGRCRRSPW